MSRISMFHIEACERQGCDSWDEYCNLNALNYSDLLEDEEDVEDEEK